MAHNLELSADLTDKERADLFDEVGSYIDLRTGQILAARTFHPHVVKHDVVREKDIGADGKPAKIDGVQQYTLRDTIFACPDCGLSLNAQRDALVCQAIIDGQVSVDGLKVTHHDVIACGRKMR